MDAQKYPDTADGALEYLKKDAVYDLSKACCFPDPAIEGVWLVRGAVVHYENAPITEEVCDVIVYLAGYKDPFGQLRTHNDFEQCEVRNVSR